MAYNFPSSLLTIHATAIIKGFYNLIIIKLHPLIMASFLTKSVLNSATITSDKSIFPLLLAVHNAQGSLY